MVIHLKAFLRSDEIPSRSFSTDEILRVAAPCVSKRIEPMAKPKLTASSQRDQSDLVEFCDC